jgi:hypothetical protein
MARALMAALTAVFAMTTVVAAEPAGPTYQGDLQAAAEVQAATQKFLAVSTWRARYTLGSGLVQTAEYVAPDRFHMTLQGRGAPREAYAIGTDSWMRVGGACEKLPAPPPGMDPRMNPREFAAPSSGTFTVAKAGPGVVDGVPVQAYTLSSERQGNRVEERLWVAVATGLPRRLEVRTEQSSITFDYFDYGAPIVINNPPC